MSNSMPYATQAARYANTIRQQLGWGREKSGCPMMWSWGANGFTYSGNPLRLATKEGIVERKGRVWLRFTVSGLKFQGVVYVILTGADDYTVLLVKHKRVLNKVSTELMGRKQYDTLSEILAEDTGIYCDQLSQHIHRLIEQDQ